MSALGVCRELILISFTPWLQPGDLDAIKPVNRFNGLLRSESHFLGRKLFHRSSSEPIDILGHLWRPQEKPLKRFLDSGGPL
jgi:hypothetical protein